MARVAVIVDSRNIRGLASSLLGVTLNPSPHGIDQALSDFRIEVVEYSFSVALPRASDRQHLAREHEQNQKYLAFLNRDQRVQPLIGSLHRYRDGTKEEKMVDVLCAVECIRQAKRISEGELEADGVLMLSQDVDVKPGIELANEFAVPVLAVSPGAIHNRGVPYMAIPEPPLAQMVNASRFGGVCGQELRCLLAQAIDQPSIDSWEFLYTKKISGENVAILRHRRGYEGAADPSILDVLERGHLYDLGVIGVAEGLPTGFPRALLGLSRHRDHRAIVGTVVGRYNLFRATVETDGGQQTVVDVSNSYVTPGTRVLLHDHDGKARPTYIGTLEEPKPLVGCGGRELSAVSVVAHVTNHAEDHALAAIEDLGIEIFIPKGARHTTIGGYYLVSMVGSGRDRSAPFVGHIASTALPGNF